MIQIEQKRKAGNRKRRVFATLLLSVAAIFPDAAQAHDPLEISATVYLHTNRLELHTVMLRQTILRIADRQAVPLLDFSIPAERDEAMPVLRSLAPGLFTLTAGTNSLRATETNVILGAEDHVGFNLTYPLPADGVTNRFPLSAFRFPTFTLNARLLNYLPKTDPYGVSVVVLDLVNSRVLEQKVLNAAGPALEITPSSGTTTNRPAATH